MFLDIGKNKIQNQTRNSPCFGMVENDSYKNHQTPKQTLWCNTNP
jgi:hypothetical protein